MNAQALFSNFSNVVLYIGMFDAVVLIIMGAISAGFLLVGKKENSSFLWDRMWPATGILLVTSVGAAIVMLAARWVAGWFA